MTDNTSNRKNPSRKKHGDFSAFQKKTVAPKKKAIKRKLEEKKLKKEKEQEAKPKRYDYKKPEPVRLNRFIANAGICSRRDADELIKNGEIKINSKVVTELGTKVNPGDKVVYQGKVLRIEKLKYVLLNKPKGFVTTMEDTHDRRTVMELVEKACEERIVPVGRLDMYTTGLLLFSNDGELIDKLTHPSHNIRKVYHVVLNREVSMEDIEKVNTGIELEDGFIKVDKIYHVTSERPEEIGIEIHSGRNRIVRRIFESLGYKITRLDRVIFAGLTKKDLPRGRWRHLTEKEISFLKML